MFKPHNNINQSELECINSLTKHKHIEEAFSRQPVKYAPNTRNEVSGSTTKILQMPVELSVIHMYIQLPRPCI